MGGDYYVCVICVAETTCGGIRMCLCVLDACIYLCTVEAIWGGIIMCA